MVKKQYAPRICHNPKCNLEFIPNSASQKFHCVKCRDDFYHGWKRKQVCEICGGKFAPKHSKQVTCSKECKDKYDKLHKLNAYRYESKRDMLEEEKNDKPAKLLPGTKEWKKASPYRRMDCMSLTQAHTACRNAGITYKEAQIMYYSNKLPDDFGLSLK